MLECSLAGHPHHPVIDYNDTSRMFCFSIPNNPISPEIYEVNLTDSTGALTELHGVYWTSQCLTVTPNLYPHVCGPFQLFVVAKNSVGEEVSQQTLLSNTNIEPTPCDCYQEKGIAKNYSIIIIMTICRI
jgi:hypothetical protein